MDHPLTPPDALIRPWRTAAYIAGAVALLELVVLLAIGGGTLARAVASRVDEATAKKAAQQAAAPAPKATRTTAAAESARVPRTKVRVLVLNGNGRQGAAAAAATRVQRRGYRIRAVGNAPRANFSRSIVMYRPGYAGEGRRLGRDLGVGRVTPLDGMRVRELQGAHVVFILGA